MVLDRFRLDGRIAVVTGASSGLGQAAAIALAEAGAEVVLAARRADRLAVTRKDVEALGGRAYTSVLDVTDPSACDRVVRQTADSLGRLDVLVNAAGIGSLAPPTRERPEDFRSVMEINLMGTYWMCQAAGRVMKAGASIVNIGSVLGLTSIRLPQAAYSASKAGLVGLTRDLAQQWTGRKGIRVNLVEFSQPLVLAREDNPRTRSGMARLSFRVDDINAQYQYLREMGVEFVVPLRRRIGPGGVPLAVMWFLDPDCTVVEVLQVSRRDAEPSEQRESAEQGREDG
jgi:NAD(P)-dependent dehydrogenase (short-subunit alcohol dehydrogenase family)